jgi:hypothetical protein
MYIYLYKCLYQLVIIRDIYLCSYSLLMVHLFCSLFNYLFCFHPFFAYLLFKREENNSDPELCSGISIPLMVTH